MTLNRFLARESNDTNLEETEEFLSSPRGCPFKVYVKLKTTVGLVVVVVVVFVAKFRLEAISLRLRELYQREQRQIGEPN